MRKGNLFPEAIEDPVKAVELGCFFVIEPST